MSRTSIRASGPSTTRMALAVLLLLAVGAAATLTPANGTLGVADDTRLDALVESALRQVAAALTQPQILLQHVEKAMAEGMEPGSALHASASDCWGSIIRVARGIAGKENWAMQMVDSSSKLVTGVLYGNLADLGNFDECVAASLGDEPSTSSSGFTGRYGLVSLDVQAADPASVAALRRQQQQRTPLHQALARLPRRPVHVAAVQASNDTHFSSLVSLSLAVCVPSTCSPAVVETGVRDVLIPVNALLGAIGYRIEAELPEKASTVAGPWRQTNAGDWVVISLCVVLLLLVMIGTTLDVALSPTATEKRRSMGLLLAFSAWSNGKRLLSIPPPSDSNFTCINGIRFLSALWVILGHRYRFALDVPFTNLVTIPKRVTDASVMVVLNAPLSVDTFFLVGGLVNAYAFMRSHHGRRSFDILTYYIHRYVRLTPAFALMVAITATWLSLLGTGPLWYKVAGEATENCRNYWWTALLYVANYANANEQCMMQSWYLMADMQLHWLSPLVLVPIWKFRRIGVAWLLIAILGSCAIPFAVSYINDFRSPVSVDIRPEAQRSFMRNMYFPTHTRITSYLCGTLAGFFLFLVKKGEIKRRITHNEVLLGWLLCTGVCLSVLFGSQPLFDVEHYEYNRLVSSFYNGFYRLAWSGGMIWIVFACIFGHGGPVNALLSWGPLTVLGRLTYGIYLTHAAIQAVDVSSMRTSDYYSDFKMVERMFSDAVLATIFGTFLTLSMESPITAIEKALRSKPRARTPRPPKDNADALPASNGLANNGFVPDDGKPRDVEKALDEALDDALDKAA